MSNAKRGKTSLFPLPSAGKRARPKSLSMSLKLSVPVLVLKNMFVGAFLCSWDKRKYDQWWEVKFVGEGIIDQVGRYKLINGIS